VCARVLSEESVVVSAEVVEQDDAADGKTSHGSERDRLSKHRSETKKVGERRRQSAGQSGQVQPERDTGWMGGIATKSDLQESGRKADGGDDDDGERAAHGRTAGVEQYARQSPQKQA